MASKADAGNIQTEFIMPGGVGNDGAIELDKRFPLYFIYCAGWIGTFSFNVEF